MTGEKRPYWHVDAKWLCGLLFTALLTVLLHVAVLWNITYRETAIALFAEVGMTMLYPAPQAAQAFDRMLAHALRQPEAPVQVLGLEVPLSGREVASLSRVEAARLVFRRLGEIYYDEGQDGLARLRLPDAPEFLGQNPGPVALFSAQSHRQVGVALVALGLVAVPLLVLLVTFSAGWGRLMSAGICLFLASLPGLPAWARGNTADFDESAWSRCRADLRPGECPGIYLDPPGNCRHRCVLDTMEGQP
jgi:hypothetical protein